MVSAIPLVAALIVSCPMYFVLGATQSTLRHLLFVERHNAYDCCVTCLSFAAGLVCGFVIAKLVTWFPPEHWALAFFGDYECDKHISAVTTLAKPIVFMDPRASIYDEAGKDAVSVSLEGAIPAGELGGLVEGSTIDSASMELVEADSLVITGGDTDPIHMELVENPWDTPPLGLNSLEHTMTLSDVLMEHERADAPALYPITETTCEPTRSKEFPCHLFTTSSTAGHDQSSTTASDRTIELFEAPQVVTTSIFAPDLPGPVTNLSRATSGEDAKSRTPSLLAETPELSPVVAPRGVDSEQPEGQSPESKEGEKQSSKKRRRRRRSKASQAGQTRRATEYQAMKKLVNDLVKDE